MTAVSNVPLLDLSGVEKSFGGVQALQGADFSVRAGEIHALLGENGAGKSTLVKILAGAYTRDAGTVHWEGRSLDELTFAVSSGLGIRVIYQQLNTIGNLTVEQNLVLGREPQRLGWIARSAQRDEARLALERLGVSLDLEQQAGSLRVAERQIIEIARALAGGGVRLLLMDEPTASLGEREVERLFGVIRGLRDEGIAIVYISHKLEEVFAISERITVLRDGRTVGTVQTAETSPDALIEMMVGRQLRHDVARQSNRGSEIVLEARRVATDSGLEDISFVLHRGEVLGVYGLMGSGRTELARAIFGADPIVEGEVLVGGQPLRLKGPGDGKRAGIGLVPEERGQASYPFLTIRENVTAASADLISERGWLKPGRERSLANQMFSALRVKAPDAEELLGRLSGGNQQKVIVGRWLLRESPILLLDDPTAGVDVGAKDEIYHLIADMTARGTSVIMSSSELPELLAIADRMLILRGGRLVGTLEGATMTQRDVLRLAVGGGDSVAAMSAGPTTPMPGAPASA
jgi:ribose transport system ATP-binding protein